MRAEGTLQGWKQLCKCYEYYHLLTNSHSVAMSPTRVGLRPTEMWGVNVTNIGKWDGQRSTNSLRQDLKQWDRVSCCKANCCMDVIKNDNCDTPNCNRDVTNTAYGDIIAKKNGCIFLYFRDASDNNRAQRTIAGTVVYWMSWLPKHRNHARGHYHFRTISNLHV